MNNIDTRFIMHEFSVIGTSKITIKTEFFLTTNFL